MWRGSSGEVVPVCTQHFRQALAVQNDHFFVLHVLMACVQLLAIYWPWVAMGVLQKG